MSAFELAGRDPRFESLDVILALIWWVSVSELCVHTWGVETHYL